MSSKLYKSTTPALAKRARKTPISLVSVGYSTLTEGYRVVFIRDAQHTTFKHYNPTKASLKRLEFIFQIQRHMWVSNLHSDYGLTVTYVRAGEVTT